MELLEPAVKGVRVEDPALPTAEMGPLISARQRDAVAAYVPADAPVAFRGRAPEGPGFWFPPTVLTAELDDDRVDDRGDLRAGRGGDAVRRRGGRDPARQRQRRTGCPARSGPRTSGGRCGSPAASRPATCRSTRTRPSATRRRSAGFKRPGWAASSDPTRSTPSPRSRTSSSARRPEPHRDAGAADGPVHRSRRGHHGGRQRHRPGDARSGWRRRAPASWSSTSTARPASWWRSEVGGLAVRGGRDRRRGRRADVRERAGGLRLGRRRLQQRGHLAARRRLDPHHRASRRGSACSG